MRSSILLYLTVAACGPGRVTPEAGCSPSSPGPVPPLEPTELAKLAGRYEVMLVNVTGEYGDSIVRGTLRLWANDSARRYAWVKPSIGRIPGQRPLAGTFESRSKTVPSYPNAWEPATPDRPAVELIGQTLYLGGIDMMDGSGERLEITTSGSAGFSGVWHSDLGIAMVMDKATGRRIHDPGGYFCAVRGETL